MSPKTSSLPPFQLRPNKFVDRMLFLDLATRTAALRGAQNYAYISMGAKFLHDHHSIYRRIGIDSLVSFDRESDDIKRQNFNRPTGKMKCLEMDSADLPGQLDELRGDKSVIIWLDFTSPKDRRVQLQQSEEVLKRLHPGDMLRVTMNSEYRKFGKYDSDAEKKFPDLQSMVAAKLSKQIPEYLPASLTRLEEIDVPRVLSCSLGMAADRAVKYRDDICIVPILSTTYADGDRMLTAACVVRPIEEKTLPDSLRGWRHRSKTWEDVVNIDVPDFSMREKQHIDRRLNYSPAKILQSLPFRPESAGAADLLKKGIENYKRFHRYYPAFHHVEF